MVVALLAILGGAGASIYSGYGKGVEVETATYAIESFLKEARSRSVAGEDERLWGVRFVNGARDYYELFSTPTTYADASTSVERTEYLPGGITFSDPAESSVKDILFTRIAGTTTPATVSVQTQTRSATLTISTIGAIY